MLKYVSVVLPCLLLAGGLLDEPVQAQQFSADLVTTSAKDAAMGRPASLRVRDDKVRIETPDFPDGFFLMEATDHAYFARPSLRTFMDARQSSRLTQWFVPVDPTNPCRQWRALAKLAGTAGEAEGWRCEPVGQDTIDGRRADKFHVTAPPNRDITGWVDPELRFPVKIRLDENSTVSVVNIQQQPQSAQLFEIPSGFRKFDPQLLIERIKQSDVWVEQPKK